VCKEALQAALGLPVDPKIPVVGSVGRLDPQKGVELLVDSVPWLAENGVQVAVLGSAAAAHRTFEVRLRELEHHYPRQVRAWIGYSEPVAHQIMGGADLFAMPSLFEPCGLTQMYAQRYGTPPVVRRTGGLADSVEDHDAWSRSGTGFFFDRPSGVAFRDALWRGLDLFRRDPVEFDAVRRRGMARDFSWDRSVPLYVAVCERALALRTR
jgi:starch synthase